MNRQNIVKVFGKTFSTVLYKSGKFGINQILLSITLSSISGISRICGVATPSGEVSVEAFLKLDKAIFENAISEKLLLS